VPNLALDVRQPIPIQCLNLLIGLYRVALLLLPQRKGDHREGALSDVRHHLQVFQHLLTREVLVEVTSLIPEYDARDWTTGGISSGLSDGTNSRHTLGPSRLLVLGDLLGGGDILGLVCVGGEVLNRT